MKLEFVETEYACRITLTPENKTELAKLFRMTNNAKAEKPEIYLSFSNYGNDPYLNLTIRKLSKNKQINSVSAYRKK